MYVNCTKENCKTIFGNVVKMKQYRFKHKYHTFFNIFMSLTESLFFTLFNSFIMSKQFLDRNLAGKIQNLTKGEKIVKKYVYILADVTLKNLANFWAKSFKILTLI